jgi:hypothetical protein
MDLEVTDLSVAAYLSARGFPVLRLEGQPGRRVFRFAQEARDECQAYFNGAQIEARRYGEALRTLKVMIHTA